MRKWDLPQSTLLKCKREYLGTYRLCATTNFVAIQFSGFSCIASLHVDVLSQNKILRG